MIDPAHITDFNRSRSGLEEFLLFAILTAGKRADVSALKTELFLQRMRARFSEDHPMQTASPFALIREMVRYDSLPYPMHEAALGKYNLIEQSFAAVAHKPPEWLHEASAQVLESAPGIGPKTSRFFIVHSREDAAHAVLDTHLLRYMREYMGVPAPVSTPGQKEYALLESQLLRHIAHKDLTPAVFDISVWRHFAEGTPLPWK